MKEQKALYTLVEILSNIIGYGGAAMVLYSFLTNQLGEDKWEWIEKTLPHITVIGTLTGLILVCISIWIPENPRPPEKRSKFHAALLIIISGIVLILWILGYMKIDDVMINGFALLGLSGSLFRLLSR